MLKKSHRVAVFYNAGTAVYYCLTLNPVMPLHRNFIYWIDKRQWKYVFLLLMLELSHY